ncbi:hypothetical protein QFC21_001356 [Naganishia friedmannii]|uniref:Uncharacterized protein n=1 Tax=Naganishia friedmannii TaxID=89922 RepID=A0ACC2W552_9TREE|nr:hypothetical protein QFC21_001356 [Naganishia friedmannii]
MAPLPDPHLNGVPLADPLALARITVLLVPVGQVRASVWKEWKERVESVGEVRLSDVPGTSGVGSGGRARFLPPSHPPPHTHLHLSYTSSVDNATLNHLLPLSLLQTSALPLAVIGIADLSDTSTTQSRKMDVFLETLDALGLDNADGMVYPLTRRCFGVEEDAGEVTVTVPPVDASTTAEPTTADARRVEESAQFKGMVEIDASDPTSGRPTNRHQSSTASVHAATTDTNTRRHSRKSYEDRLVVIPKDGKLDIVLGMLLADVCASVLAEFGEIAGAVESPAAGQMLTTSLLPTLTTRVQPVTTHRTFSPSNSSTNLALARPKSQASSLAVINNSVPPPTARTPSPLPPTTGDASRQRAFGNTPPPGRPDPKVTAVSLKRSSMAGTLLESNPLEVINTANPRSVSSALVNAANPISGSASGRLKKVLADLWLLSGRLGDAIYLYTEATQSLKNANDYLWQASATEGLATASWLDAWETRDLSVARGNVPFHTSPTATLVHDLYNQALALYARSPAPPDSLFIHGSESGRTVISRLYTACALRHARFLLAIWSAGGFGQEALDTTVRPAVLAMPRLYPPPEYPFRKRVLMKLSTMSRVARVSISTIAMRAHGPWLRALPIDLQLQALVTLVGVHRLLGLERREAVLAREVVAVVVAMIADTRIVGNRLDAPIFGNAAGRDNIASQIVGDSIGAGNAGLGLVSASTGTMTTVTKETGEGNQAVLHLVQRLLDVFGLDLSNLTGEGQSIEVPVRYGWAELQVAMLREAITAAETLPDYNTIIGFSTSALRTLHVHLAPQAQQLLLSAYSRALAIARRRNVSVQASLRWLPDNVVVAVDFTPLTSEKVPFENNAGRMDIDKIRKTHTINDPFLYNPRSKSISEGHPVFIAKDALEVTVTLRNPFGIDLEIQNLSLSTQGVKYTTQPLAFILPPTSVHRIRLEGIAHEPGNLAINGCNLRLGDGNEYTLPLPLTSVTVSASGKRDRKRTTAGVRKLLGLDARPSQLPRRDDAQSESATISCSVLKEQPLILVRQTSLNHGSVILHQGEKTIIHLTLENTSSIPVDFLNLAFEDNLKRRNDALLDEGNLSETRTHELERDAAERPVLQWDPPADGIVIAPGQRGHLRIKCFGKPGWYVVVLVLYGPVLTPRMSENSESGTIRIDYGQLPEAETSSASGGSDTFYSRQLVLPILFTVQPALRCSSLRVTPFASSTITEYAESAEREDESETGRLELNRGDSGFKRDRKEDARFLKFLRKAATSKTYSCAEMTMFNPGDYTLEFILECRDVEQDGSVVVRRLIAPGVSERFIFPIARPTLSVSDLERDVPRLSNRQFVVDRSGRTQSDVLSERRQFWIRQALLGGVKAWWNIALLIQPGSERTGEVSLRDAKIPASDLDALQEDRVRVSLVIHDTEGNVVNAVEANTPIVLNAAVVLDVADESIPEFKYLFEPIIDPLTPLSASDAQVAVRTPRWRELEFLSRVVAFSGPADGILVPHVDDTETPETTEKTTTINATAVVCLFADGVYKFRVRIWTMKDGKMGEERSAAGTYKGEREAVCVVHVRTANGV